VIKLQFQTQKKHLVQFNYFANIIIKILLKYEYLKKRNTI